jgi:hypothetical protein
MPKYTKQVRMRSNTAEESYNKAIALKSQLASLANDVREKCLQLRLGDTFRKEKLEKQFKPITSKLDTLITTAKPVLKPDKPPLRETHSPITQKVTPKHESWSPLSAEASPFLPDVPPDDFTYGVSVGPDNSLVIGQLSLPVNITTEHIIVGDQYFPRTSGLYHLLWFKSIPKCYTQEDLENYHQILAISNAAFLTDSEGRIKQAKGSRSKKYKQLIQPYLEDIREKTQSVLDVDKKMTSSPKTPINKGLKGVSHSSSPLKLENRYSVLSKLDTETGEGIAAPFMKWSSLTPEFVYYDNIEELVNRLRILVSSRSAGNTNVNNEILNIEEELREAGVIE